MPIAEEVRNRRMDGIKKLTNETLNAFEWILKLLDAKTAKFEFEPLEVFAYVTDNHRVRMEVGRDVYTSSIMNISSVNVLLLSIKKVIDAEDGYSAKLKDRDSRGRHGDYLFVIIE